VRRFLAAALVALGLVGMFVAIAGTLGPHLEHMFQRPSPPSAVADYVGDWECETLSLDLHVIADGPTLSVTGLDTGEIRFVRDNDRQPFHEVDGERQMMCQYKHLSVFLADGKEYGFRLRQ